MTSKFLLKIQVLKLECLNPKNTENLGTVSENTSLEGTMSENGIIGENLTRNLSENVEWRCFRGSNVDPRSGQRAN